MDSTILAARLYSDFQPALNTGNRCFAGLHYDLHCLVVERILLRIGVIRRQGLQTCQSWSWTRRRLDNFIDIARLPGFLEIPDHGMDLVIRHERAVDAHGQRRSGRQIQHVAVPQQVLSSHLVEDRSRIDLCGYLECDATGDVCP